MSSCVRLAVIRTTALVAVAALAGCVSNSPPMRYFTLSDVPPAQKPPTLQGTGTVPPPARLGAIAMPAELDRQQLVTHSSGNQVQVHEFNRWAAPLEEQIRRTHGLPAVFPTVTDWTKAVVSFHPTTTTLRSPAV